MGLKLFDRMQTCTSLSEFDGKLYDGNPVNPASVLSVVMADWTCRFRVRT